VEKYDTTRQLTDDNTIRRMRLACCIIQVTGTHSKYVILMLFHFNMVMQRRLNVTTFVTMHLVFLEYGKEFGSKVIKKI
jgi:hypothetical protein